GSYAGAASAVTVSLAVAGAQNTLGAGTDTLVAIENLSGSAFNDTLTGDSNANVLMGLGGDDFLVGGGGNDTMAGGSGNDTFQVNDSGDQLVEAANEGNDTALCPGSFLFWPGRSVQA